MQKMDASQCIEFLDYALILSGNKLYISNCCVKWTNLAFRTLFLLCTYLYMVCALGRIAQTSILYFILDITFAVTVIALQHVLLWRCDAIKGLLEEIVKLLAYRQLKQLKSLSRALIVLMLIPQTYFGYNYFMVLMTTQSSVIVVLYFGDSLQQSSLIVWKSAAAWILHIMYVYPPYLTTSMALYSFVLCSLLLAEKQFFLNSNDLIAKDGPFRDILLNRRRMNSLKDRFEQTFNLIPFIWFVYFFNSLSGYLKLVMDMSNPNHVTNEFVVKEMITFVITFLYACAIIVFIQHYNNQVSQLSSKLIATILNSPRDEYQTLLIDELEVNSSLKLTGWDMFDLNKAFILNFISALITFSVLFIGLSAQT